MQPKGPEGPTQFITVHKRTALSQVPGLSYGHEGLASLPRPSSWEDGVLTAASKQAIDMEVIKKTVYNPKMPDSVDEMLKKLDERLAPLIQYCEANSVTTCQSLVAAPRQVQMLLFIHKLRPQILKYIQWRQSRADPQRAREFRVYADAEELEEMKLCHQRCLDILDAMLKKLDHHSYLRALDVAGGDGRLTLGLLIKLYLVTDLFDQCPVGLRKARLCLHGNTRKGLIARAPMQSFIWKMKYTAIYMVWCVGYLDNQELENFLRKAKPT